MFYRRLVKDGKINIFVDLIYLKLLTMKISFPKMIYFFIMGALLFSACGSDDDSDEESTKDTTSPTISTTVPVDDEDFAIGGLFYYEGTFSDDVELKQVVFSLEDQASSGTSSTNGIDDEPWEPDNDTIMLSGTEYAVDQAIFDTDPSGIPSDVYTGVYTLTITCSDAAGNVETETVDVNIGN
jgi:hypothetical protein